MRLIVNGQERHVPPPVTIRDVIASLGVDPDQPGLAVAVSGLVVARRAWHEPVAADARVEVVRAAVGG
jgi:sulfur carrier protein